MKTLKAILLALAMVCLLVGTAVAEEIEIGIDVVVAVPFTAAAGANADLGTLYPGAASETFVMDVSGCAIDVSKSGTITVPSAGMLVIQGTKVIANAGVTAGSVTIVPAVGGLDLDVTFVSGTLAAPATLSGTVFVTPTIPVVGTRNNISKYATCSVVTTGTALTAAGIAFGPQLTIAADVVPATYSGKMVVNIFTK
ncbi:hypothetical protein [Maridesulfovibrio frigidus]|uniref:hypothetical protein n=1 Tax=Maridesulfovibrio frigidus TaxID=340956 RepID=UPI0004E20236|nr:hypothetical protein [Maridesulfovibrio frigidus]